MINLSDISVINNLQEDEGIHLDVEIYKPIKKEKSDKFGLFISHEGSSGSKREYIVTSEDIGNCIKDYIENCM